MTHRFILLLFLFMLTIYDVLELCEDELKLREWLRSYAVLKESPAKCSKCASGLKPSEYRGKPGLVCTNKGCRARVYAVVGGPLEGPRLWRQSFC